MFWIDLLLFLVFWDVRDWWINEYTLVLDSSSVPLPKVLGFWRLICLWHFWTENAILDIIWLQECQVIICSLMKSPNDRTHLEVNSQLITGHFYPSLVCKKTQFSTFTQVLAFLSCLLNTILKCIMYHRSFEPCLFLPLTWNQVLCGSLHFLCLRLSSGFNLTLPLIFVSAFWLYFLSLSDTFTSSCHRNLK